MIMPNTTIHEELKLPPFDERGKFRKRTELLPIQYQAIAELVSGTDKTAVCKKLKISRTALYHWLDNDVFATEYKKACEKLYKMSLGTAMNKLNKLMETGDSRTSLKAVEDMLKLNSYLNANIDINKNTNETITIKLLDEDEPEQEDE